MKKTLVVVLVLAVLFLLAGCNATENKAYDPELEQRVAEALERGEEFEQDRPDYLPENMFSLLPEFPKNFYSVRQLVRTGTITDFGTLGEEYWKQPEFFPNFEDIGLPILQNPPKDRWGAQGYMTYPADTLSMVRPGEQLDVYFFIKSSYLVETYQGIMFDYSFPSSAEVTSGELPEGGTAVQQDPEAAASYFTVELEPNPFILEPNFPVFRPGGTIKVKATIRASPETPAGNYVVAFDTVKVPEEQEDLWIKQYLNRYVSGTMTKLSKPYHQAFLTVPGQEVIE